MSLFVLNSTLKDKDSEDKKMAALSKSAITAFDVLFAAKETFFWTDGSWSLYDFILYVVHSGKLMQKRIDLYVTTYSMTELSARVLAKLHDEGFINLHIVMDYKAPMRYPGVDAMLKAFAKIGYTQIHAKTIVLSDGDTFISMVGSANWTKNRRVECGQLSHDKGKAELIIDFVKKFI